MCYIGGTPGIKIAANNKGLISDAPDASSTPSSQSVMARPAAFSAASKSA